MRQRAHTRFFILIVMFGLLTGYAVHWMRAILTPGLDFQIYYEAVQSLLHGGSAYLPYEIGKSFVYHPSVLSVLSLLAALPLPSAYIVWLLLSIAAYAFSLYLIFTHFQPERLRWRKILPYLLALLLFAPFLENLYIGQINTFVSLLLILCLLFDEHDQPLPSGICLALAILLKTSPAILLVYFLSLRRFRVILSTLVTLVLISLLTLVQFGPQVYADFLSVISFITGGRVELGDYYNPSMVAITYRILSALHLPAPGEVITWMYRLIFGGLFAWLMFRAWRGIYRSALSRYWLFSAVMVIMTVVSPLVWYHHNVFLLLPLGLALLYRTRSGIAIMLLIQAERLIYNFAPLSIGRSADTLPLALALTAGTATLIGQLWLLGVAIQSANVKEVVAD